ncbi:DUF397 domain-containing protein [Dactylosporangium vinaceum]|uniref:DUF397 domain-containing protein n=1 Tax=Dactylosporangium vinaceum TaxID=53362 RepID=A0ABV5MQR2_9ACTN|nr:DUF397 domain-containing protein [Dactylosporangium vinaceum]UAB96413.1 DUF397 domain-containing protein [Dactylosporangium vinaceum]
MFSYLVSDPSTQWKVSTRSGGTNCVEVATTLPGGGVAIRDTKDRRGPVLLCSAGTWRQFLTAVQSGAFDPPSGH